MKKSNVFLIFVFGMTMSAPAYAASWGALKKGACDGQSGKRAYTAKLKRNFGDDPAASLCPRLHKTVDGKSRVPDTCEKKGLGGYTGIWLVDDKTCTEKSAARELTPQKRRKSS